MTLIDAAARAKALDTTQSFIVQAPAGSGKTGLLIRRILKLLLIVEKPEEVLAITFTKKATAEIRARVFEVLHKVEHDEALESHELDIEPYAKAVLARDAGKNWQLLRQPERLKIQTIDGLNAELVRKMPWSSRFGASPQIETELDQLYQQAAQNTLQKIERPDYKAALSTLLIHASGNLKNLQQQLAKMLHSRQSWLRVIISDGSLDDRGAVEAAWFDAIDNTLDALDEHFGSLLCQDLLNLARYAQANRPDAAPDLEAAELSALYDNSPKPCQDVRLVQWQHISHILCTPSTDFRSPTPRGITKAIGFPNKDDAKAQLIDIILELKEDDRNLAILKRFRACPSSIISDSEWERLSALKTVLLLLAQELGVLMSERNCSDYDELSQRAIEALGLPEQPTELALIQDYQLKHILMDEFQDTSLTQLTLLERLTAGWEAADGRSLFLVGDPMQSIYAFRKADVRVFLQVWTHGLNDISLERLTLSVNFRSSNTLIEWVNATMRHVFPAQDMPELSKVKYSPSDAFHTFEGAVHYYPSLSDDVQTEATQTLKLIQSIQQNHPKQSITVLARSRKPLTLLAQTLRSVNLAFESVELETLAEQSLCQDLISLTRLSLHPLDTLAGLAVLRAPWCGLNLSDLSRLRATEQSLLNSVQDHATLASLSPDGQTMLARVLPILLKLANNTERGQTLSERIRGAWLALRAPACYAEHHLIYAEHFFNLLDRLEEAPEPLTSPHLLQACERTKISSPANNLKLMTIHKAKGLEYDHILLIGMNRSAGGDQRTQTLFSHTEPSAHQTVNLVAPAALKSDTQPTKASFIQKQRKAIEAEESARLLYVAVTRAKRQLYLFASLKKNKDDESKPKKGSFLNLCWDEIEADFMASEHLVDTYLDTSPKTETATETATETDSQTSDEPRPSVPLLSLPNELPPLMLPTAISIPNAQATPPKKDIEYDWAQDNARLIGIAVHQLLEFADHTTLKHWQKRIDSNQINRALEQTGFADKNLNDAQTRITRILNNIAHDPRAAWLFSPEHQAIKTEWPLSGWLNDKVSDYIIDRSFIDEHGTRWIVDFKTSAHEGGNLQGFLDEQVQRHAPQLNNYARLVQALEPDRSIKLGVYFAALKEWREWDAISLSQKHHQQNHT